LIGISDLVQEQLLEVIMYIEENAKEGMLYNNHIYYGEEVKKMLGYEAYKTELENRLKKEEF